MVRREALAEVAMQNVPQPSKTSKMLCKAFNLLQLDEVPSAKAVKHLRQIHENLDDHDEFFRHFIFLLRLPLSRGTGKDRMDHKDEKILETACRFVTSYLPKNEDSENEYDLVQLPPLLRRLFDWLLDHHEVEGSGARLRICMMVNRLLRLLGEEAEIDDDLYQKIYDNMLQRLKDKVAEIRSQAVNALQRLQDPRDENCPIIGAFIFHLGCDPSALVRRAIVKCIGATRFTLGHVLKRTLDVDETVRKAAYKFIADKVHIRSLTIGQREEVVRRGLTDRSPLVQQVVAKDVVPAWLRLCNESVLELLHALDVGNSDGKTAKEVLSVLFQGVPYKELLDAFNYVDPATKLVPLNKLTPETATYWKNLAQFLHEQAEGQGVAAATPFLEALMPELTKFCAYVRAYILEYAPKLLKKHRPDFDEAEDDDTEAKEVAWLFNARQLIDMTNLFDLADEVGRNNLAKLCKELLANRHVPSVFVEKLMKIHRVVQTNAQVRIQEVAEIIAELRDPMKDDRSRLNDANQKEEEEDDGADKSCQDMIVDSHEPKFSKAEMDRREEIQRKKQVEVAKIRVQLNILRDDLESAIQNQNFVEAQELKLKIDQLDTSLQKLQDELAEAAAIAPVPLPQSASKKVSNEEEKMDVVQESVASSNKSQKDEDPTVVHKCLVMLAELLQSTDITSLNATLQTILDEFVVPSVKNMDFEIRNSAVRTLGCFCLRNVDAAKQHIVVILSMSHLDAADVRMTALAVVFDLLMWFGVAAFMSENNQDNVVRLDEEASNMDIESVLDSDLSDIYTQGGNLTHSDLKSQGGNPIVAILSRLLDDTDIDIRTRVAEGLCKLLISGAITSAKLLTRLILMWYNPLTEANGKLRHILGTFFPLYGSFSRANQDTIEEAFMPTLKTLFEAPATSPLMEVDVEDVGLFLIQLTSQDFLQKSHGHEEVADPTNVHDAMAYSVCSHIISTPDSFHVKTLLKLLLSLQITTNNYTKLKELKIFQDQMAASAKDKLCVRNLEKFGARLDLWLSTDPDKDKEDEQPEKVDNNEADTANNSNTTMNSTKLGKKRTLFSQTCNTLLEEDSDEMNKKESKCPVVKLTATSNDDDDMFASPLPPTERQQKRTSRGKKDETEVTRIEESPDRSSCSEEDSSILKEPAAKVSRIEESFSSTDDDDEEQLVSGNLFGKPKQKDSEEEESSSSSSTRTTRRARKPNKKLLDSEEEEQQQQQQQQQRRTSGRRLALVESSADEASFVSQNKNKKATKKKKKKESAAIESSEEDSFVHSTSRDESSKKKKIVKETSSEEDSFLKSSNDSVNKRRGKGKNSETESSQEKRRQKKVIERSSEESEEDVFASQKKKRGNTKKAETPELTKRLSERLLRKSKRNESPAAATTTTSDESSQRPARGSSTKRSKRK